MTQDSHGFPQGLGARGEKQGCLLAQTESQKAPVKIIFIFLDKRCNTYSLKTSFKRDKIKNLKPPITRLLGKDPFLFEMHIYLWGQAKAGRAHGQG